ncbi:hypothetical protein HTG_02490 [Natrinema mahii]|nr:hypothetical protein HTG_02490 [Natrinema mahii]
MARREPITIGHYYPKTRLREASGKAIFIRELAAEVDSLAESVVYSGVKRPHATESTYETVEMAIPDTAFAAAVQRSLPILGNDDIVSLRTLAAGIRSGLVAHINTTVDVLITHYYLDDLVLSRLVDVPTIYQYHGFSAVGVGGKVRERLSATDIHVANSHATAAAVTDALDREVDHVVTPGVDVDRFSPDAEPAFDRPEPTVTFVGRLAEAKGVFDLLDAFEPLSDDAHLCFVGDGAGPQGASIADALSRRVRELGIGDDVTFFGEVPHDDLHRYYAASDIVCYPTYYDGFGLVNIEAMACGVPVVTTRVDGVEAYATHEENSLLVEPGEPAELAAALRRLVSSPRLRDRLGTAGRTVAERYSWRSQAESLIDFCTTVAAEPRARPTTHR